MTERPVRPQRIRLPDFSGRLLSLGDDGASWRKLKDGQQGKLLLGIGPDPEKAPVSGPLLWHEAPEVLRKLRDQKRPFELPDTWQEATASRIGELAASHEVWFYSPGLKLAPEYWGPILARISLASASPRPADDRLVWLPGQSAQLLHEDLLWTLKQAEFQVVSGVPEHNEIDELFQIWSGRLPAFALSINFRGLDPEGRIFELCRALNIPVAIWLVDNPWNILSGISLPWWKEAQIFLTDTTFIVPLKENGARNCHFLPLAASPLMLAPHASSSPNPPVFIGTSGFAGREKYFAGLKTDSELQKQALARINSPELPDFHWWQKQLSTRLWPGREARRVSLGCDECSAKRRSDWIKEARISGLEVIGDNGWQKYLPDLAARAQVPYADLPSIYAGAECVLNVTSLLLPGSLNQRHFDVWAAGGFLFTDSTPGLEIFPQELTGPISLASPADFRRKLEWLRRNPEEKDRLCADWRELIANSHTYGQRLRQLGERLGVKIPGSKSGK